MASKRPETNAKATIKSMRQEPISRAQNTTMLTLVKKELGTSELTTPIQTCVLPQPRRSIGQIPVGRL